MMKRSRLLYRKIQDKHIRSQRFMFEVLYIRTIIITCDRFFVARFVCVSKTVNINVTVFYLSLVPVMNNRSQFFYSCSHSICAQDQN